MKKLLALVILSTGLFASTVVDIYRDKGIRAVKSYILGELQTREFWNKELKDLNLSLGYYENLDSLLLANKQARNLTVYRTTNNSIEFLVKYKDIIVGADGDKYIEGDLKTPLGAYMILRRFVPPDPFYGPLSFVLSYPNIYDRVQGKNGHGIWIHGSPLDGSPRDPMSKGCIVLDNETVMLLDSKIESKSSMVIVSENRIPEVKKSQIVTILSELFRWKESWIKNDIETYMSFYADEFKRYDGMSRSAFYDRKKRIFAREQPKEIIFRDINISPYPQNDGRSLFRVAFYQLFDTSGYSWRGDKVLYVELSDKSFEIITER